MCVPEVDVCCHLSTGQKTQRLAAHRWSNKKMSDSVTGKGPRHFTAIRSLSSIFTLFLLLLPLFTVLFVVVVTHSGLSFCSDAFFVLPISNYIFIRAIFYALRRYFVIPFLALLQHFIWRCDEFITCISQGCRELQEHDITGSWNIYGEEGEVIVSWGLTYLPAFRCRRPWLNALWQPQLT